MVLPFYKKFHMFAIENSVFVYHLLIQLLVILYMQEDSMKKQVFKVLDYIDDNGVEQSLNFECNTPHVLILGNNLDDIVGLEKKMLKIDLLPV